MADKKISALTAATLPLAGTEVLPIVQSGTTKKVAVDDLTAGKSVAANTFSAATGAPALSISNQATGAARIQGTNTGGTFYFGLDSSGGGLFNAYSPTLYYTGNYPIVMGNNGTLQFSIQTNGDIKANVGNLVVGTAGKGITTGGATALGLGVNNAVDAVTIDASNNVRVGTNTFIVSASEKFSIDCGAGNGLTTKTSGGASTWNHFVWNAGTSGNNGFIEFGTEASYTARGSITYDRGANQVAYNVTSDARLKTNVADADDAGEIVDAIKVRQFDWVETGSHMHHGFVAQELYEAAPVAVTKPEDDEAMWSVDYSKLVPILVKEIQSLRTRVAQLEGN